MAFKMNKPSIAQGTAGHRSATESHLKMSALKAAEDSEMALDYSYNPDSKAISYEDAYMKDEVPVGKEDFMKKAKAWNMKTYGTHNPTADAKKGGMTKAELAKAHKAKTSDSSSKPPETRKSSKMTGPGAKGEQGKSKGDVRGTNKSGTTTTSKNKGGTLVESSGATPGGSTVVNKDRNSNQDNSRIRNADGTMKSREVRAAEAKARKEKEAAATAASKAPESKTKLNERLVTKTKSHTGATTKTVDRGGKVRREVSKDSQGNKSVIKYDRKGNVKKTGKQRRAEKATKKDAELAEKKTTYATKKAEMNAKNARVKAEKTAKNNAEGDKKKANTNKAADALEKDVAASAMKNMTTGKYNNSFAKKKSKY